MAFNDYHVVWKRHRQIQGSTSFAEGGYVFEDQQPPVVPFNNEPLNMQPMDGIKALIFVRVRPQAPETEWQWRLITKPAITISGMLLETIRRTNANYFGDTFHHVYLTPSK